jgi:hypothetical protein
MVDITRELIRRPARCRELEKLLTCREAQRPLTPRCKFSPVRISIRIRRAGAVARVEPVSVISNLVSSNKIWISKNRDQRPACGIRRLASELQRIQPQRLRNVPLTRGNVALIFTRRTCPRETVLVRWGTRIRTWRCCSGKSPLKCRTDSPEVGTHRGLRLSRVRCGNC